MVINAKTLTKTIIKDLLISVRLKGCYPAGPDYESSIKLIYNNLLS